VIARIGPGHARDVFLTGERFKAPVAHGIGLVQHVVPDEAVLDSLIESKMAEIRTSAPGAIAAAKRLIAEVSSRKLEDALEYAAEAIADARAGNEGQEGMKAFMERQKPPWAWK